MNIQTFAILAGVSASLILTGSSDAEFVGITTTSKPNEFGIFAVNVYAIFDRPDPGDGSGDHMIGVFGTPDTALTVKVFDGVFYNNPFGGDQPPSATFIMVFPSLAYDTFVTIGKKTSSGDTLTVLLGFPLGITGSILATTTSGWMVQPTAPQGDPFDAANSYPGNGQIIIGQFSTAEGSRIEGKMLLQYISNSVSEQTYVGFCHDRVGGHCPVCEGDCGNFDGDVGIVDLLALLAVWGTASTCDIDGGGVGVTDFLQLLANWGPCLQQPTGACCLPGDTCEQLTLQLCNTDGGTFLGAAGCEDCISDPDVCISDIDGDGTAGILDFLFLLSVWGTPDADIDGDGTTGITDMLLLLSQWGPCP